MIVKFEEHKLERTNGIYKATTMKFKFKILGCFALLFLLQQSCKTNDHATTTSSDPWTQVDTILARIVAPTFPDKNFNITDYGAKGDSTTDCTEAFAKAIA